MILTTRLHFLAKLSYQGSRKGRNITYLLTQDVRKRFYQLQSH